MTDPDHQNVIDGRVRREPVEDLAQLPETIVDLCTRRYAFTWCGHERSAGNLPELLAAVAGALEATDPRSTLGPMVMSIADQLSLLIHGMRRPAQGTSA